MRLFLILTTRVVTLTAHAAAALTIANAIPKPGRASAVLAAEVLYDPICEQFDVGDPSKPFDFPFVSALLAPGGTPNDDFDGLVYASGAGDFIDPVLGEDRVDLLFDVTANKTGEHWGDFVLVTLGTEFDPNTSGLEQFPDFKAASGASADVTLQAVQPSPLPAALPMLLGAVGTLVLARRGRRP